MKRVLARILEPTSSVLRSTLTAVLSFWQRARCNNSSQVYMYILNYLQTSRKHPTTQKYPVLARTTFSRTSSHICLQDGARYREQGN
jgi:hypothetical protein